MKIHTNPLPIAFALVLSLCLVPSNAPAAFLNWGDFDGDTVTFKNVTEDNGEATTLFAPASGPSVAGDMLILDPQGFQSQSNNGADLIDSTLSTRIVAKEGNSITSVFINEFGDYSLGGLSNGEAFASVGAAFFW